MSSQGTSRFTCKCICIVRPILFSHVQNVFAQEQMCVNNSLIDEIGIKKMF